MQRQRRLLVAWMHMTGIKSLEGISPNPIGLQIGPRLETYRGAPILNMVTYIRPCAYPM